MGKFAKLVNTEEKIAQFKSRYGIPEDVHIRYVPYGDLALLQRQDLVLPIVAIVEGGCAPNVFRIVMGTAVLMEKICLNLTVHDITYVYNLQTTGRDQYTLVAHNVDRKLVTGLPDSSKGRDEDFLVFTGNWQNPHINCPLRPGVPDKEFTAKKIEFVERKTVEHLLAKPCFIDSGGLPRAASILLDYVPSYKSFQNGPTVKHFRQEEVTVVRPGKDQEDIIQAVPVTARRGVQVPQLVPPLSNPEFVPSLESSKVGLPIIRFPSFFDPDPKPTEEMLVQKRSVNIASVLGTSAPETSETSPRASSPVPPAGFSQGEDVMRKKRKRGKEQNDDASGQEGSSSSRLPKAKAPKRGKSKNDRDLQKATVDEGDSVLKNGKGVRGGEVAAAVGKALLLPEDMKVWQEKRSKHMLENLKRDSILNQVTNLQKRLDREYQSASQVRVENGQLKDALTEAEAKVQKSEEQAQAYYDQGFNEATDSLLLQLKGECNKYFVQGWHQALDNAEERNEEAGEDAIEDPMIPMSHEVLSEPVLAEDPEMPEDQADDQIQAVEPQEGEDGSDDENIDVID
uniref:Uncharacterized protein n=1 Tax=Fagus sylvatica TaxID=28930 RepID=A0A2N9IA83_FAGSY